MPSGETNNNVVPTNGSITPEVVVTQPNFMQALIKADFELLGTTLVAEYYKDKKGEDHFLLMPTGQAESRGITVDEMINDICYLIGLDDKTQLNIKELEECIDSIGLNITDIKVVLRMAYFYSVVGSGTTPANASGQTSTPKQTEYAFQLEIDTSAVLPDTFKLFNINRVGFAVWNTERPKIISQMNLYKPEDLLNVM